MSGLTVTCACCGRDTEAEKLEVLIPSVLYHNLMRIAASTASSMTQVVQNALALYEREHSD